VSIVVNSTPLISLSIIGKLDLLQSIFGDVYMPRAVYDEVLVNGIDKIGYSELSEITWFQVSDVENVELKRSIMLQLDVGEAEVITVAKDKEISLVCIDEFAGRQYANLLGLDVVGTLGVLLIAKHQGYISNIKPLIDKLIENERYISKGLYEEVLRKAGEL